MSANRLVNASRTTGRARTLKGESYCCKNCVAMASGASYEPGLPRCAHCEMPIVDDTTKVEGAGKAFCCNNCAIALAEAAPHRT